MQDSNILDLTSPSQIQEQLRFETMLADLSARFINLSADQIDTEIEHGLKIITKTLNIDRCSVDQISSDRTELKVTHGYAVSGIPYAFMRKRSEQKLHDAFNEIKELKNRLEAENTYLREEVACHKKQEIWRVY